jgi:hypothetical protein
VDGFLSVHDVEPREAQHHPVVGDEPVVAPAVPRERLGLGVELVAVGLEHDAQRLVGEVDPSDPAVGVADPELGPHREAGHAQGHRPQDRLEGVGRAGVAGGDDPRHPRPEPGRHVVEHQELLPGDPTVAQRRVDDAEGLVEGQQRTAVVHRAHS